MIRSVTTDVKAETGALTETILKALPGDQLIESNGLASVTTNCLIVRSSEEQSRTIIPIVHLSDIRTAKTTYPGLLVISAACFLIAAGAYCSKQEGGAAIPCAVLAMLFLLAYLANRRVAVLFITRAHRTVTRDGKSRDAAAVIKAVRSAQAAQVENKSSS